MNNFPDDCMQGSIVMLDEVLIHWLVIREHRRKYQRSLMPWGLRVPI